MKTDKPTPNTKKPAKNIPIIDCDSDPIIPDGEGVKVIAHSRLGKVKWNKKKFEDCLYVTRIQRRCSSILRLFFIHQTYQELVEDEAECLNINVLDFLVSNPEHIPQRWYPKSAGRPSLIYFFGTVFGVENSTDESLERFVPALKLTESDVWVKTYVNLGQGFNADEIPTALTPIGHKNLKVKNKGIFI